MKHPVLGNRAGPALASALGAELALALALTACTLLSGCAHTSARVEQRALSDLQRALPGVYTSTASGSGAANSDTAVSLTVSAVTAQQIGDAVYFVRETPANNPNLVLWQGVWTLIPGLTSARGAEPGAAQGGARQANDDAHGQARILQHSFLFKEPRRWTDAVNQPDLLQSMLPQDLQPLAGCDLIWYQTATGFETSEISDTSGACHPGAQASGLWIEQHARLEGDALSLTERPVDSSGALDAGAPIVVHLSRSGSAP